MEIRFSKSNWAFADRPLEEFLDGAAAEGFAAVELYLPWRGDGREETGGLCRGAGLDLIAHISTEGATVEEHLEFLERWFAIAADNAPALINSHTGKDHFAFADNVRIFERALELSRQAGIPMAHETHRGRALFSCHGTRAFLRELPELRITADFSHWVCVAESDLRDQAAAVAEAVERTDHVHARVGFDQGPQVADPRSAAGGRWLERFREFWSAIIVDAHERGQAVLHFTPEFGPKPYVPVAPPSDEPVCDVRAVNLWMREWLAAQFTGQPEGRSHGS